MISFQNARVEMKMVSFCSELSSLGSSVQKGAWECFMACKNVCCVAIDLLICMENIRAQNHSRFLSYRVMAL